jgi:hypothetical protein
VEPYLTPSYVFTSWYLIKDRDNFPSDLLKIRGVQNRIREEEELKNVDARERI